MMICGLPEVQINKCNEQQKHGNFVFYGKMEQPLGIHYITSRNNPIEVAECAVANKIAEEPAFASWIKDVLHICAHIINTICSHYWK